MSDRHFSNCRELLSRAATLALAFSLCFLLAPLQAHAQHVDVTPFAGYLWGGTINVTGGDVHIQAAPHYGGTIGSEIRPGYYGELSYFYQGSEIILRQRGLPTVRYADSGVHYILLSGSRDLRYDDTGVMPFVTGGIGATIFTLSNPNLQIGSNTTGSTVMLFALGGGFKVDINEKIGLKLQTRLLLPTRLWSSGVYFGTGGGGVSVSGTTVAQGDAFLGLTFKLGD